MPVQSVRRTSHESRTTASGTHTVSQLQPLGLEEPPSVCGFSPRLALAASDRHRQPASWLLSMSPPLLQQPAILQMTKSGDGGGEGGRFRLTKHIACRSSLREERDADSGKIAPRALASLPPLFVLHCISSIHCTRLHATLFLCATGCVVTALAHLVHVQLDTFFF